MTENLERLRAILLKKGLNSLSDYIILCWSKFKAHAEDKIDVTQN